MIDPLPTWLAEFEKLPPDTTGDQAPKNITDFLDARVTGKLDLNNSIAKFSPPPSFTWQKALFQTQFMLLSKIPAPDPISPALKIAQAWQTATMASTMVITAGATVLPPPPGSNGQVSVAIAIVDPATLALAVATLISDLSGAKPSPSASASVLPKALYKAFTSITFTVTGVDTKVPPLVPAPILLPLTGVM